MTTETVEAAPVRAAALTPRRPSLTGALLAMESLLLGGGQRTARRNAWTSVLEDRQRARERVEVQRVLDGTPVTAAVRS
ncbi:SCO2195 family GlnR-regulated protein [Streptomyces sp. NPDC002644]